jgi:hypothetical protein
LSKVWKFNIKIDLGRAKELTVSGVIGGVLIAVLAEGAATITHLVIDHRWNSVVASGQQMPPVAMQAGPERSIRVASTPFRNRWPTLPDSQVAPVSFVPWWHFYAQFSSSALDGAPHSNGEARDQQVLVVPMARK